MGKHHALARRLIDRQEDYLRFTVDPRVPFDNYAAERQVRMIKLRQKVSDACARSSAPSSSVPSAAISPRQPDTGIHFFQALTMLAEGRPWLPETA